MVDRKNTAVGEKELDWERCQSLDCEGARMADRAACLAHADPADREGQLRRFGRGRPLDARGVLITAELWEQIIDAAPTDDGAVLLSAALFDSATIDATVSLDDAMFRKNASFQATRFRGAVALNRVKVKGQAQFSGAVFEQGLSMTDSRMEGPTWFAGARFEGPASFSRTKFWGPAWFTETVFGADAMFEQCGFEKSASFTRASFAGKSSFAGADFGSDAEFDAVGFTRAPSFESAAFRGEKGVPHLAKTKKAKWWGPPLATWTQRVKASLIDTGVGMAIGGIAVAMAFGMNYFQQYLLANILLVLGPLISLRWTWTNLRDQGWTGQTLGKRVVGLRLLSERDRRPVGPWRSVGRALAHIFDTLPLFLGWFRPLVHPKRQTFADTMTRTVVVFVGKNFARASAPGSTSSSAVASH